MFWPSHRIPIGLLAFSALQFLLAHGQTRGIGTHIDTVPRVRQDFMKYFGSPEAAAIIVTHLLLHTCALQSLGQRADGDRFLDS